MLRISTVVDLWHRKNMSCFGSAKNFYCCRSDIEELNDIALEVLRISTVVDLSRSVTAAMSLEVLRISTVVDITALNIIWATLEVLRISTVVDILRKHPLHVFGSAKNFYCCRS